MRSFDYFFLNKLPIPDGLSTLLTALEGLHASITQRLPWSGAQANRLLANREGPAAAQAEQFGKELILSGYHEAFDWVSQSIDTEPSVMEFLHIHSLLLPEASLPTEEKRQALESILSAYHAARSELSPLLLVPCVALDLTCISPFSAGSHAAAILFARQLLCSSGWPMCRFAALENEICRFFFYYQNGLSHASEFWKENSNEYLPYLEAFLSLLYLALKKVLESFPEQRPSKGEQIRELVLNSPEPISKAEICAALPEISPTTVEAVLGGMVKEGAVRRVGGGRGSRYLRA